MNRSHVVGWLAVLFVIGSPPLAWADREYETQIARARELLQLLVNEEFDAFVEASDDTMRNALPAKKLKEAWEGIEKAFGSYQTELKVSASPVNQWVAVDIVCQFKIAALNARITLDEEGRAVGLFFRPSSEGVEYEPPNYVDRSRFREESVTVSAGKYPLSGMLTVPVGGGPFSAVVLVHGSGPHDADETIFKTKPFKDIAWGLGSRGIAVLRYEKRTHRYPDAMDPTTLTIDEETTEDAIAAVRLVAERDDVDRVYVLGHSLGATAGPYIAEGERKVDGLILLAAAARPIYELVEEQIAYLAGVDGEVDEKEKEQVEEVRQTVRNIRNGTTKPGDTLLGAPVEYWKELRRLDPVERAKSLSVPILIVQGGRDYQVSEKDYALWKKGLGGRKNVTFKRFEKMDHLFHSGEGLSRPEQYMEKGYVDESVIAFLADWVLQRR